MSVALLLHLLALALVSVVGGWLYWSAVSSAQSSTKALRILGIAAMVLVVGGAWSRVLIAEGAPRAWQEINPVEGYFLAWLAVLGAGLLAAWAVIRVVRYLHLERRRNQRRLPTLREMHRRDAESEDTFVGKTFTDLEASVEWQCRDHLGPKSRVIFEFLDPLSLPEVSGWLTSMIRCPLAMAMGDGAAFLEIAALREAEKVRRRVQVWRAALVVLLLLNPAGFWFARGVLFTLEREADLGVAALGDEAASDLRGLILYQVQAASKGRHESLFDPGPDTLRRRLSLMEGNSSLPLWAPLTGAGVLLAAWGWLLVALGPVDLSSIAGIVSLKAPPYITAGQAPPGLILQAIPGAGFKVIPTGVQLPRDGVRADTSEMVNGLAEVAIAGTRIQADALSARIEVKREGGDPMFPPTFYLSLFSSKRSGMVTESTTIEFLKFIPLHEGVQEVVIPLTDKTQELASDTEIYMPSGWVLTMSDFRVSTELPDAQPPAVAAEAERRAIAFEDHWASKRVTFEEALDWGKRNVTGQEGN